jgi:heptosyltransferase II
MNIPAKPWTKNTLPKRILAIRLQAMGDVFGTLPYLQDLRKALPARTRIDFLTREETDDIPRNILLFNRVYSIGGGRDFKKQLFHTFLLLPKLFLNRYELMIDLQNNILSRIVRKTLKPEAWTVFDRFSPISGGERYRLTIEAAGIGNNKLDCHFFLRSPHAGLILLRKSGYREGEDLVLLNPAGAFETRNWPVQNYIAFSKLWIKQFPNSRFLILGTNFLEAKTAILQAQLGEKLINLTGKTSPSEAFGVLQHVKLVLSEDSGLMHMAWGSGIPTLALFGGTRSDWSRPLGAHSRLLDSSDLPCGACMKALCQFGDVHCLTRYSPEKVFQEACNLLEALGDSNKKIQPQETPVQTGILSK